MGGKKWVVGAVCGRWAGLGTGTLPWAGGGILCPGTGGDHVGRRKGGSGTAGSGTGGTYGLRGGGGGGSKGDFSKRSVPPLGGGLGRGGGTGGMPEAKGAR